MLAICSQSKIEEMNDTKIPEFLIRNKKGDELLNAFIVVLCRKLATGPAVKMSCL